jgi:hypothetical protein
MENNTTVTVTIRLTVGELQSLSELVNEKQDMLFERLQGVDAIQAGTSEPGDRNAAGARGQGLRESLRYWDGIERQVQAARYLAQSLESKGGAK